MAHALNDIGTKMYQQYVQWAYNDYLVCPLNVAARGKRYMQYIRNILRAFVLTTDMPHKWEKNMNCVRVQSVHDDAIKWRHFPRYWPFVLNSPHKGQWRGTLMFYLICAWTNRWVYNQDVWWFETPSRPLWRHCNDLRNPFRVTCCSQLWTATRVHLAIQAIVL